MSKYFLVSIILFLIACSGNHDDLKKYISKVNAQQPKPIKSPSESSKVSNLYIPTQASTFHPFKPIYFPKKVVKAEEKFDVEALKFVGFIQQGNKVWALIESLESKIIRIRIGDYLVKGKVLVKKIKGDSLILEQTIKAAKGVKRLGFVLNMRKLTTD